MQVIIGSHFVPLESKFLLIALVIVRITIKVFATGGNNIVEQRVYPCCLFLM
jgi:hypothetical protein